MALGIPIFISAVTSELKSARQLVANTLQFLGYDPVWQDVFGSGQGDLRGVLRKKIDDRKGVIQLVGRSYGLRGGAACPRGAMGPRQLHPIRNPLRAR